MWRCEEHCGWACRQTSVGCKVPYRWSLERSINHRKLRQQSRAGKRGLESGSEFGKTTFSTHLTLQVTEYGLHFLFETPH